MAQALGWHNLCISSLAIYQFLTQRKNMKLSHLSTAALLTIATASAFAQAKPPAPDYTLSFNAGVTTDYRYRGISQSRLQPAVQGGLDFAHKSGFYAGAWGSTIKWIKDGGGKADIELDIYGGYKGSFNDSLSYDVGVLGYIYPGHKLAISPNTTEIYGALTMGPVTGKYSHSVTNLFGFPDSKSSGYLDLSATFDMGSGWSVVPHLGHQSVSGSGNGVFSYTDYSLAVNKDFGNGLVASASIIGTDAKKTAYVTPKGKFTGRTGLVLGVKYNF
jgi:uncharacterized protein (TIGR02001 family)